MFADGHSYSFLGSQLLFESAGDLTADYQSLAAAGEGFATTLTGMGFCCKGMCKAWDMRVL